MLTTFIRLVFKQKRHVKIMVLNIKVTLVVIGTIINEKFAASNVSLHTNS